MNIYQARKAAHMCVRCGRITERTLAGKCRCQECEDKTVVSRRYRNQLMRKKHLCIWCGKPSEERLCPACREIERRRAREWIKKETHLDLDDYTGARIIELREEMQKEYDMGVIKKHERSNELGEHTGNNGGGASSDDKSVSGHLLGDEFWMAGGKEFRA